MGRFSHKDRYGGAIEVSELREVSAKILEKYEDAYTVMRMTDHINSPNVATDAIAALHDAMT